MTVPDPNKKTYGQRKAELDAMRFIDVRNLAHLTYKKPDGTELMSYHQTLGDRELVKKTVLDYELALGMLVPDTTDAPAAPAPGFPIAPVAVPAAPQGVAPMSQQPFQPPFPQHPAAPQGNGAPVAAPQAPVPMGMPPPPAAAQAPAEAQAAPTGRKRRTAVAPPPPAAGGVPGALPPPPQAPQGFAPPPPAGFVPPQAPQGFHPPAGPAAPAPVAFGAPPPPPPAAQPPLAFGAPAPVAPPQAAPPAPAPQQQQAPGAAGTDLGAVMAQVNQLGAVVNVLVDQVSASQKQVTGLVHQLEEASKGLGYLQSLVLESRKREECLLAALHHLYITNPTMQQMAQSQGQQLPNTLPDFQSYMAKFIGSPG